MLINVTVTSASMTHTFSNGTQIVSRGSLECSLYHNPDDPDNLNLRLQKIHYKAEGHTEYIAKHAIRREPIFLSSLRGGLGGGDEGSSSTSGFGGQGPEGGNGGNSETDYKNQTPQGQAPTPNMTPSTSSSSVGKGKARAKAAGNGKGATSFKSGGETPYDESGEGLNEPPLSGTGGENGAGGQHGSSDAIGEKFFFPDSLVNDFGITLGMMRCLEVSHPSASRHWF